MLPTGHGDTDRNV